MEPDLFCPLCHDIFKDAIILNCCHSFCELCLQDRWKQTGNRLCPLCKRRHSKEKIPPNLAWRLLSDNFRRKRLQKMHSESFCSLHSEKLKLFCLDHQEPVCIVCKDSEKHTDHKFRPVDEAARDHRRALEEDLESLVQRWKGLEGVRAKFELTAEHIEAQARRTERKIRETFERLRQFLADEEEMRLAALREEEEQKTETMKKLIEPISEAMEALSDAIKATEKELKEEDISFLFIYKDAVKRVKCCPLLEAPTLPPQALIDVSNHLGNLSCSIWSHMKDAVSYSPLSLDPNTAHPNMVLSDDLTSVGKGESRQLPENPERIKDFSILGSQGFDSGIHSWDVEVGANPEWKLGVLAESVREKAYLLPGLWIISFHNGAYRALIPSHSYTPFTVRTKPRRIRVSLDFNKGMLTFFNPDTNVHIYTFTNKFKEKVFPYLYTESELPLKVLPLDIRLVVEQHVYRDTIQV